MGCGGSSGDKELSVLKKKGKGIDNAMADQARQEAEKIKLLLLGAGESGKSTIFKQMKVIYGEIYSDGERKQQLPTIYSNVLQAIKVLAEQAVVFNLVGAIQCKAEFDMIRSLDENGETTFLLLLFRSWLDELFLPIVVLFLCVPCTVSPIVLLSHFNMSFISPFYSLFLF